MMEIKNLLITDDHAFIIDGIITGLKEKFMIGNIAVCYSPQEAIDKVENQKYDLYILDLGFRTEANIDVRQIDYIRKISKMDPKAKIIVFTMREDFAMVSLLKKLKHVKGIVLKGPEKKYLQEAVKAVLEGNNYLCPRFKVLHKRSEDYRSKIKFKNGLPTEMEITILRMVAMGMTSESIANKLGYKTSTIISYRRDLKEKLNVDTSNDMIVLGLILNYINIDDLALDLLSRID
ncbi:response regulator transcription factor [Dysgonomonas sp. BGC7]|uniref:response regulator n=1 Tax=Dysgonomonas sp. BGC7 TaxID=1658008 RepID=UPI00068194C9|nr:response regulator transcription factor [Dysgonomonas sp. BGC7]MBD8388059.1 response regulator transcription factor [Dysgonomonas sp. BGC7]